MTEYEKGIYVEIADTHEAGIWRGLSGTVARVRGPLIQVDTPMGRTPDLSAEVLKPLKQERLDV
jgi:hypothetical protein